MIAAMYKRMNIIGSINSSVVPFVYFLLLLSRFHSSLNGLAGSLFSMLFMTAYFSVFSCLKFRIKKHHNIQMTSPAINRKMDLISQIKDTVAINARFKVTNKLFMESLRWLTESAISTHVCHCKRRISVESSCVDCFFIALLRSFFELGFQQGIKIICAASFHIMIHVIIGRVFKINALFDFNILCNVTGLF